MLLTLESDVKNEHLILVYNSLDHKAKSFACFDIFPVIIKLFNTLFIFLMLNIIYSWYDTTRGKCTNMIGRPQSS